MFLSWEELEMRIHWITALLLAQALAGCSTVVVDQAQGMSASGKEYVAVVKKVNDLALDRSIDFTANLLPGLPRTEEILTAQTEEIKKRALLVGRTHEFLDALAAYFSELEALAKGDQSEATARSVGQIADSLKGVSLGEIKLTAEKKTALTGLAAFVARQGHAAVVEKALIRDADVVAQALALSEKILDEQIDWITLREKAERRKKYRVNVLQPYVAGGELGSDWKKAWSNEVRTSEVVALLLDAKHISIEMQKAWINVLRGQHSYADLQASLKNVKADIDAIAKIKDTK
jgi:hypothetical protein